MKALMIRIFGVLIVAGLSIGMVNGISRLSGQTDPRLTNFAFFWLAGRMTLDRENPYDQTQYLAGHDAHEIGWRPNTIFPYPLPLVIFFIPLGFFSLETAYWLWKVATLLIIAAVVLATLYQWAGPAQRRLFISLFTAMFFFGPVYLTLRTGSVGAFSLLVILIALLFFQRGDSFYGGVLLSLTILKPPQGLTILVLFALWSLARRDRKAIYGMVAGGVALLLIGLIQDPLWVIKFRTVSASVLDRTQGVHSNVWAFSYLACNGASPCWNLLGWASSLIVLAVSGLFLWRKRAQATVWEVISFIIPIGFVSTVYLWEYDQILYIIPIIWVIGTLVQKTRSYIHAFLFLIALVFYAFFAVAKLNSTGHDLWSLGNTLILLAGYWLASILPQKPELKENVARPVPVTG
jgi:hypothetical protein